MKGFEQTMNNKTTLLITILLLLSFIFGALVGGLVIKYEGKIIDGSLFNKHEALKEYLKK